MRKIISLLLVCIMILAASISSVALPVEDWTALLGGSNSGTRYPVTMTQMKPGVKFEGTGQYWGDGQAAGGVYNKQVNVSDFQFKINISQIAGYYPTVDTWLGLCLLNGPYFFSTQGTNSAKGLVLLLRPKSSGSFNLQVSPYTVTGELTGGYQDFNISPTGGDITFNLTKNDANSKWILKVNGQIFNDTGNNLSYSKLSPSLFSNNLGYFSCGASTSNLANTIYTIKSIGTPVQLFTDPKIEKGFHVYPLDSADGLTVIKTFPGRISGSPEWGLVQWFSRFDISTAIPTTFDGGLTYENMGKSFTLSPATSTRGEIYMQVNGSNEYMHHRLQGDPWPHLYIYKDFGNNLQFLKNASAFDISLTVRQAYQTIDWMGRAADPLLHSAQFLAIFTVQDRNMNSPGYGDYFWLNVPIYDNRLGVNNEDIIMGDNITSKPDATGKLIYIPKYSRFAGTAVNTNNWVTLQADLLPLMEYGFNQAKARGYMKNSSYNDLAVGTVNIGWEVTGTYDCAIRMKDISLIAYNKN